MMRFLLIVAVFLVSGVFPALAATDASRKGKELDKVQTNIKQINQNIKQIQIKRELLSKQLRNIEKQYGKTAGSLRDLKKKISQKRQRLEEIKKEMKARQVDLSLQNHELSGQIKAAYIMGQKEKLKLLLNQQDPALASRMMVYYDYLNQARLNKLTVIKNHIEVLTQLAEEKQRETRLLKQAISLRKDQQVDLAKTKQQRKTLLAKLNRDFSSKSKQLNQLEENEKELRNLIVVLEREARRKEAADRAEKAAKAKAAKEPAKKTTKAEKNEDEAQEDKQATEVALASKSKKSKKLPAYVSSGLPFHKLKGKLPWPIQGKLVKKFGSKRSDTRWDGVLISASEGTDIHAVTDGRVVFADWLRGYGLLVIIDHGKGYMTLYAFNQSLYKKVGDRVKAGTVIASVGKSGGRSEAGLYFGVRRRGKPVNPVKWCRKVQSGNIVG